ncbi:MAG: peroxiredoxin [Woeseiaceae bacterium]|nr:peroxiredoxin [Woeseiaceae bacterium]
MAAQALNRVVADFKCQATGGQMVQLKALRGSNVVLYFYPKDATPGCTTEGQEFRDLHARFRRLNTQVFGVSKDSLASHEKFREKQQFPFHLISDPDETLCRQFDVIREKSLYGRKFMGIERSTFLIDATGKLRTEWRKVKVKGHAEEVLEAVKNC